MKPRLAMLLLLLAGSAMADPPNEGSGTAPPTEESAPTLDAGPSCTQWMETFVAQDAPNSKSRTPILFVWRYSQSNDQPPTGRRTLIPPPADKAPAPTVRVEAAGSSTNDLVNCTAQVSVTGQDLTNEIPVQWKLRYEIRAGGIRAGVGTADIVSIVLLEERRWRAGSAPNETPLLAFVREQTCSETTGTFLPHINGAQTLCLWRGLYDARRAFHDSFEAVIVDEQKLVRFWTPMAVDLNASAGTTGVSQYTVDPVELGLDRAGILVQIRTDFSRSSDCPLDWTEELLMVRVIRANQLTTIFAQETRRKEFFAEDPCPDHPLESFRAEVALVPRPGKTTDILVTIKESQRAETLVGHHQIHRIQNDTYRHYVKPPLPSRSRQTAGPTPRAPESNGFGDLMIKAILAALVLSTMVGSIFVVLTKRS